MSHSVFTSQTPASRCVYECMHTRVCVCVGGGRGEGGKRVKDTEAAITIPAAV